jgi:hypothetical protein
MVVLVPEPVIPSGLIVHDPVAGRPVNITLPVERAQVGWVIVPNEGAEGAPGVGLITTSAEAAEIHPSAFVYVKLYVPEARPERVVVAPEPDILPGLIVHAPVAGNPFNITLLVGSEHVGCVMDPTVGAGGVAGTGLTTTSTEDEEVHPASFVTVKL